MLKGVFVACLFPALGVFGSGVLAVIGPDILENWFRFSPGSPDALLALLLIAAPVPLIWIVSECFIVVSSQRIYAAYQAQLRHR